MEVLVHYILSLLLFYRLLMMSLKTAAVVTSQWLKETILNAPKNLKVLDATWGYNKNGFNDYVK